MVRFWGLGAAMSGASMLVRNSGKFLKVALFWALVRTAALMAYCGYVWFRDWPLPFDIGGTLYILRQPDQFVVQYAVTMLPDIFGSLAVPIWWTRFVLSGALPKRWIDLPRGSARYFSREFLIAMVGVVAAIPGLLLAGIASRVLEQPLANQVAVAVVVLDAIVLLYGCARFWLIFPAIAIGNDHIRFRQSLRLTKKAGVGLLLGFGVAYLVTVLPAAMIERIQDLLPLYGRVADAIAIAASILVALLTLAGTAIGAAVTAALYKARVDIVTD